MARALGIHVIGDCSAPKEVLYRVDLHTCTPGSTLHVHVLQSTSIRLSLAPQPLFPLLLVLSNPQSSSPGVVALLASPTWCGEQQPRHTYMYVISAGLTCSHMKLAHYVSTTDSSFSLLPLLAKQDREQVSLSWKGTYLTLQMMLK